MSRDKESLESELSTLKSNFEQISTENVELRKNVETAREQVDAANKVFLF
jgi:predicted  nucleic acid-binding Zn-ribbon protein